MLSLDDVAAFWAIDCALEATFVPDEELARARSEGRVQQAVSGSSMGTAETYWHRVTPATTMWRDECAVVPPGRLGEDSYDRSEDDRDRDAVLWRPFRSDQHAAIERAVTGGVIDVVLEEAARRLVIVDRAAKKPHAELQDWLIAGGGLDPEFLRRMLRARRSGPKHLVLGIRARWLDRSVSGVLDAITAIERLPWNSVPRLDFMRFAVRAARHPEGAAPI